MNRDSAHDPQVVRTALLVATLATAVVGVRVHELLPFVHLLRPAALVAYGGLAWMIYAGGIAPVRAALREPTVLLVIAYWLWAFFTAPLAIWPGLAITTAKIGIPLTVLVILIGIVPSTRDAADELSRRFVFSAVVLGVLAVLQGSAVSDAGVSRLTTEGGLDSNDLAALMAIALPFGIGAVRRSTGRWRIASMIATGMLAVIVVRTGSRGGTVALVMGCLLFVLGFPGWRRLGMILGASAAIVLAWFLAPQGFRDRMISMRSIEQDYNYTAYTGRKQVWARARIYIRQNLVKGVGAGNFPMAEGQHGEDLGIRVKWSTAHNTYLQVTAELGLIGASVYFAMLLLALIRAVKLWWPPLAVKHGYHRPEYLAALGAFATGGYFLSHAYFYPVFAMLALNALASRASLVSRGMTVKHKIQRGEWRMRHPVRAIRL
jgi:O-antigen ligase